MSNAHIAGTASGVPFVAIPPQTAATESPIVVAWHLMDPPRTESAMAAALPLDTLEAWRIYLGLPMCGARTPAGGVEEVMRLGYEDAVVNLLGPAAIGAADEFPAAYSALRDQLDLGTGPVALIGGSIGAAAAQLVSVRQYVEVAALTLVSPVIRLRTTVAANERVFDTTYEWSDRSHAIAEEIDFVKRAGDLLGDSTESLVVVGSEDDQGFRDDAEEFCRAATAQTGRDAARLVTIDGMGHGFAEEPGIEAAPQNADARKVDSIVTEWLETALAH